MNWLVISVSFNGHSYNVRLRLRYVDLGVVTEMDKMRGAIAAFQCMIAPKQFKAKALVPLPCKGTVGT